MENPGDVNCSKTDWKTVTSGDAGEKLNHETLIDNSFEQSLAA